MCIYSKTGCRDELGFVCWYIEKSLAYICNLSDKTNISRTFLLQLPRSLTQQQRLSRSQTPSNVLCMVRYLLQILMGNESSVLLSKQFCLRCYHDVTMPRDDRTKSDLAKSIHSDEHHLITCLNWGTPMIEGKIQGHENVIGNYIMYLGWWYHKNLHVYCFDYIEFIHSQW